MIQNCNVSLSSKTINTSALVTYFKNNGKTKLFNDNI